ncbi:MAG: YhcH/YjgK/YiaL family protein [Planctomycetota bacterium]
MIHDTLAQADRYTPLLPDLDAVLAWLRSNDLAALAPGRYDVVGTGDAASAFVKLDHAPTRDDDHQIWETHRRFIDIQLIVAGTERMGVLPLDRAPAIKSPYNPDTDFAFYHPPADPADALWFTARPGDLAIFFPTDVHAPSLDVAPDQHAQPVIKAIGKIVVA